MTFEEELINALQKSILKQVQTQNFINFNYNDKKVLPPAFLDQLWASMDWDDIIEEIRPQIQTRICNSIVAAMETETKTDIKKLLSVDGVRQKLRIEVYPKLMKVLNEAE